VEDHVSTSTYSYIHQESWFEFEVHWMESLGVLLSSSQINYWRLDDHFQDGILGKECVGVIVFDIFKGNEDDIMTHVQWPLLVC